LAQQVVIDSGPTVASRAQSRTIYLNKNGVTLSPGANDSRMNRSSLTSQLVSIPPWNASSTLWADTVTCMRDIFAPFDITITETDPGNMPHIEAVFTPSAAVLGFPQVGGVSPFSSTCSIIENSIVFTFTNNLPQDPKAVCETMAQEIGHSYGLDHELLASDPMTYLSYANRRAFQNVLAECGESSARPCGIQGYASCRDKQNSYALLMERIGAAGTGDIDAPAVAIQSPQNGAVVDEGFAIMVSATDDVSVKGATLSIDGVAITSLTTGPWQFTAPADLGAGKHVVVVSATDGKNAQTAMIEVTIAGEPSSSSDPAEAWQPAVGCASTRGQSGALVLLALVLLRKRSRVKRARK